MSTPCDVEWALQAALRALEHAPQECPYHGQDFERAGFQRGEPRCDSCKQPWRVWRALRQIQRATDRKLTDPPAPAPYNPDDAEDCAACLASDDICPYHRGVNIGIQMAARKLTAWAEGSDG